MNGESPAALPAEIIFDLLSNDRRRYTMCYLLAAEDSVTVRDLSRDLAAWENGVAPAAVTPAQRKRVYTALHQTHLVRLDEFDVVDYERNRGHVTSTPVLEETFGPLLEPSPTRSVRWREPLFVLGFAGVALGATALLGAPVVDLLPAGVGTLLIGAALLAVTVFETGSETDTYDADPLGYIPTTAAGDQAL